MKKIKLVVTAFSLLIISSGTSFASCSTVHECAQEAVEAALTANSRVDLMIPKGAVLAFALEECPLPYWKEYEPAYGRFIRGIDKKETPTDPDGNRDVGSIQQGEVQTHSHIQQLRSGGHKTCAKGGNDVCDLHQFNYGTSSYETKSAGGAETRPVNVALLYCVRQ